MTWEEEREAIGDYHGFGQLNIANQGLLPATRQPNYERPANNYAPKTSITDWNINGFGGQHSD
jgi:hypothetical protein